MAEQSATKAPSVVHARGEGEALWMLGGLYETRLSTAETGGALTCMEFTIPIGASPPPHVHQQDEAVYILEGTGRFHFEGRTVDAGPGTVLFFPKGTEETFEPTTTMRMLAVYTPGGIDRFFAEAGEPAQRREVPPAPTAPPDVERLASIGARYGLELRAPH